MKRIIILTGLFFCFVFSSCHVDSSDFRDKSTVELLSDSLNPAVIQNMKVFPESGIQAFYVAFQEKKFFATGSVEDSLQIGSRVDLFSLRVRGTFPSTEVHIVKKKK